MIDYFRQFSKVFIVTFIFAGFLIPLFGVEYDPNVGVIARVVANILADQQYRRKSVDDALSKELFKEYLDTLDPAKVYFTKEDISGFSKDMLNLDNQLLKGNISFAFLVYDRLLHRMKEYRDFADKTLDKGFDFTKDEDYLFNRKDAEHPTSSEQKELWRKRLKNDYLNLLMIEKVSNSEEAENSKTKKDEDKKKISKLWQKSPKERLKKRIASSINILEKKIPIERLEFYLTAFANIYDPHSSYMAPRRVEDFDIQMKLSLVGIGAVLTTDGGYTKIVRIIKGGPASKDGQLEADDRIVAVAQGDKERVDIVDMPLSDVVQLIRGTKGTTVKLSVLKGKKGLHGVPEIISIIRDVVKLEESAAQKEVRTIDLPSGKSQKIGIITLSSFYTDFQGATNGKIDFKSSTRDVKKILEEFNKKKIDGVIFDLRRNGGGGLREAILLTGLFFDKGPVVQIKGASNERASIEYDRDNKTYYNGPLIVMINKLSASATEILAGAIQDYGRGVIVGDQHSHGKGTVQTIMGLDNIVKYYGIKFPAGALKLTNAKFYRINGDSTQIRGVVPDIIFPNFTDPMEIGEKYLEHALPWDSVPPAKYIRSESLVKIIPGLRKKSEERRKNNEKFKLLKKNIKLFDDIRKKKKVSLNEKVRWDNYQKEKKIIDQETAILTEEEDKDKKKEDLYMDETINILNDLIEVKAIRNISK